MRARKVPAAAFRNGLLLLACLLLVHACSKTEKGPYATLPFSDDFERSELGRYWYGDPGWRIKDGQVFSEGTANRPLWLRARLPREVVVEFDARSDSTRGDIKFEIFGDGKHHASGYILIFGGWKNTISTIARLDEHGEDRVELRQAGLVKSGKTYRFRLVRRDKVLKWYIDGKLFLDYYDSEPLHGPGHDRFAFNDWQSPLYFDNLSIRPLEPSAKNQ
ncbi:MAG: hypothetical protein D6806_08915 [Deltaproteobacteria bacterium]|nr:MAG: hypothetical protein D6806_08915 [Deltaproteobacteria bacterium]